MRLRQIALLARDLEATVEHLRAVLGLEVAFRDPAVATFGLANAVLPAGDCFLEVVSPIRDDASGARLLARRGGDGCGYMAIVQTDDLAAARERARCENVRVVFEHAAPRIATIHLHPRDVGGAILSFDEAHPSESWDWAGPDWKAHVRRDVVAGLAGATLTSDAPAGLAAHWAALLGRPASALGGDVFAIALDGGTLRFGPAHGAGEGLACVELHEASRGARDRALGVARSRGLRVEGDALWIAGTALRLVEAPTP